MNTVDALMLDQSINQLTLAEIWSFGILYWYFVKNIILNNTMLSLIHNHVLRFFFAHPKLGSWPQYSSRGFKPPWHVTAQHPSVLAHHAQLTEKEACPHTPLTFPKWVPRVQARRQISFVIEVLPTSRNAAQTAVHSTPHHKASHQPIGRPSPTGHSRFLL